MSKANLPTTFDVPAAISDDDVYVNSGESYVGGAYYPGEPEERKEIEQQQAAERTGPIEVLQGIYNWFDQQIKDCDNIHNIEVNEMTVNGVKFSRKVSVEAQVLALQLLKERFVEKRDEFKQYGEGEENA